MRVEGMGLPWVLPVAGASVRPWQAEDLPSLVAHANNRNVAHQLRDRFPHPYEPEHGRGFLSWLARQETPTVWAIAVEGRAVGGIGLELGQDVERVSAEIGYWLGERFWGRGIATAALDAVTARAFALFDLSRIFAVPFAGNAASIRVLEKAGYVREGHLRHSAVKDGVILDQYLYARYR
ncbi:MAG: GNAT family N-acetyltransferase [Vicinamibacterales bacterium]